MNRKSFKNFILFILFDVFEADFIYVSSQKIFRFIADFRVFSICQSRLDEAEFKYARLAS